MCTLSQLIIYQNLVFSLPDPWNDGNTISYIFCCRSNFHNRGSWYDWVAVANDNSTIKRDNATDYKILQLMLIFKYIDFGRIKHHLTYVCYFKYQSIQKHDMETGLWIVNRTESYEVIPISRIVYTIHLIPLFNTQTNVTNDMYSFESYLLNWFSDRIAFKYLNWNESCTYTRVLYVFLPNI